ncbi:ScbR family autoregulator-binding transcription factor [Streptomyces sp. NPDC046215]|uniref:ScbR family autoregulator-binding transcription factor n=1 Tax=Streptomyces stramineus TaxID=173861 RepID=A0ABP3KEB4_9ACTN
MTKQERAMNTRHALIRSAAQAFDQHGYTRAKLSAISAGAGVSSGALHFHFDTKAAMAAAVETEATRTLHAITRNIQRKSVSPLQTLIDTTHAIAEQLRWDVVTRAGFRLNCRPSHTDPDSGPRPDLRAQWHTYVTYTLTQAAQQHTTHPSLTPRQLTTTIVGATAGFEALARQNHQWLSHTTVTTLWQTLLPTLATPSHLPQLLPGGTHTPTHPSAPVAATTAAPEAAAPVVSLAAVPVPVPVPS